MTKSQHDQTIDYIEFHATDIPASKAFFEAAFGWTFVDYGPDYTAFKDGRLDGGFTKSDVSPSTGPGAALVVLYAVDLEAAQAKVLAAGGKITEDIFSFPGGRRFHFEEPSGNVLAVWNDLVV